MTYKFPSIWFASGTTSLVLLCMALCVVSVAMWGSISYLWNCPPRSLVVWKLAATLWFVPAISIFMIFIARERWQILLQDVPPLLLLPSMFVIVGLPLPALAATLREIAGNCQEPHGFRDMPTWGAMASLMAIAFVLECGGHRLSEPPDASQVLQCSNNLKHVSLAHFNAASDNRGSLPAPRIQSGTGPDHSWRIAILPYLDLPRQPYAYNKAEPWGSASNSLVAQHSFPRVYHCPLVTPGSRQDSTGRWYTAYAAITGPRTAFPNGSGRNFDNFPDGPP